ncbi:MAG: hypothetical protein J6330_00230 [Clostridia bacterium]|nr:hypothetical protein [Clostridia bacterium]
MKKLIIVSLLLAAVMLFCACTDGDDVNTTTADTAEAPSTTEPVGPEPPVDSQTTEAPDDSQTTEEVTTEAPETDLRAEFFADHTGYWTEKNGRFITFGINEKGEYRATFAVWNAGGPFPSGNVTEVKKAGDGLYFLLITIDGMPDDPEWYGDGWDPYDVTVSVIENKTNPASFDCVAVGDSVQRTYYNHQNAANPFLDDEPEVSPLITNFVKDYAGYWTNTNGRYIHISDRDGGYVEMAVWNAGGDSGRYGKITEVRTDGKGSYLVLIAVEGRAADEMSEGWSAYDYVLQIVDLGTADPRSMSATHVDESEWTTFYHHDKAEDPFLSGEIKLPDPIGDFINEHKGYWTNKDGRFIYISDRDGGFISFAVWNSGGGFPGGTVTDIKTESDGTYVITIAIAAMEDNDESSGWAAYTYVLKFKDLNGSPRKASATHAFEDSMKEYTYHTEAGNPFLD